MNELQNRANHTTSDDGVKLYVDGEKIVSNWSDHPPTQDTGSIYLTQGQDYTLKLEYYEGGSSATIQLKWTLPASDVAVIIPASQLFPPSTDRVIYLHGDHLGSVSAASNSGGARISQQEYDPWGKVRPVTGSPTTTQQTKENYTGQKLDDTGLLFYNARYYDPGLGRFISPDSIVPTSPGGVPLNNKLTVSYHEAAFLERMHGENSTVITSGFWFQLDGTERQGAGNVFGPTNPQSLNRYSYALNNPVLYTDPSGHAVIYNNSSYPIVVVSGAGGKGKVVIVPPGKNSREMGIDDADFWRPIHSAPDQWQKVGDDFLRERILVVEDSTRADSKTGVQYRTRTCGLGGWYCENTAADEFGQGHRDHISCGAEEKDCKQGQWYQMRGGHQTGCPADTWCGLTRQVVPGFPLGNPYNYWLIYGIVTYAAKHYNKK